MVPTRHPGLFFKDTKLKKIYTLKDYFHNKYNTKVYKITIDAGFTCPNRDGAKAEGGCVYCNSRGSGTGMSKQGYSIEKQVHKNRAFLKKRYNVDKFYLYYQSFSNTYASVDHLKKVYDEGLQAGGDSILGLIIGTRPDCIDEEKLELLSSYSNNYDVWLEYGLQTIHKKTLDFINRHHSIDDYKKAINMAKKYPLKITSHIIVGLPYETYEQIMETVQFVLDQNHLHALKIHSLYIPRDSRLAEIYEKENFPLMSFNEYVNTVVDIIKILPDDIILARMTGEINHHYLLAPKWAKDKQKVINAIHKKYNARG